MLKKIFKRKDETGLSLVEVVVAASMMVLIMTASALALASGFNTASVAGKKNQASQFAQQVISIAKQAPFDMVGLSYTNGEMPSGIIYLKPNECNTAAGRPDMGEIIPTSNLILPTGYPGLVYCQNYKLSGIKYVDESGAVKEGTSPETYLVMTEVEQVKMGTFDSLTSPNPSLPINGYVPRRVTVTVWWGDNNDEKVVASFVRTPSMSECIPPGVVAPADVVSEPIPSCVYGP